MSSVQSRNRTESQPAETAQLFLGWALSSAVDVRNELVKRWADVARTGPTGNDIRYFFAMLTSSAEVIVSHCDDAIFFTTLLHDQCYLLGLEKFGRPTFRSFRLPQDKTRQCF